ncbi:MAG: Bax inhibitor-1/YccA family protein [Alphaproteobacteria bacterium]|nr:Bax inhibitor-1/YccA family protein [Alphaproteobacteria bacterium]
MADFDNRIVHGATTVADTIDTGLRAHMLRVYNYMVGALALTGGVAYLVANTPALLNLFYHQVATANGVGISPTILGYIVMFAPLALVFFLSFRIMQMSQAAAQATFWAYAAMVGASLASILIVYTGASVAMTFFVTAATFGSMSLWGYTTNRDLTGMGHFLMMGVCGLFIAMIANMFFKSPAIDFAVSALGVVIFTGLTAWDTQKIKNTYYQVGGDTAVAGKAAIMGALSLYLDFLNIFLFLLRFMGNRR